MDRIGSPKGEKVTVTICVFQQDYVKLNSFHYKSELQFEWRNVKYPILYRYILNMKTSPVKLYSGKAKSHCTAWCNLW
jgi:hypothetical protein